MNRRNFIKKSAMLGFVPVAILVEKAVGSADKKEASEVFKIQGNSGKWYKIKTEALEETDKTLMGVGVRGK